VSVDRYLDRRYHRRDYHCLTFSSEVWLAETGQDIVQQLAGLMGQASTRKISRDHVNAFARHDTPQDPCLVLFQRPRTAPHVGVYLRGRVLHITDQGVEYQPIDVASRSFETVRFYTCKK